MLLTILLLPILASQAFGAAVRRQTGLVLMDGTVQQSLPPFTEKYEPNTACDAFAGTRLGAGKHIGAYLSIFELSPEAAVPSDAYMKGLTHLYYAFFDVATFQPLESPNKFPDPRAVKEKYPDVKNIASLGGWGANSILFRTYAASAATRKEWAANLAVWVNANGFDGVDIDWEYPVGGGEDYKQVTANPEELPRYVNLLCEVRQALGKDKIITAASPAQLKDIDLVYQKSSEMAGHISNIVDQVNIMSYDMMDRRSTVTSYQVSLAGTKTAVEAYKALGFPETMLTTGYSFTSKWFQVVPGCTNANGLGCPTVLMEDASGQGIDGTGGAVYFDRSVMGPDWNVRLFDDWRNNVESKGVFDATAVADGYLDPATNYWWTWSSASTIQKICEGTLKDTKLLGSFVWPAPRDEGGATGAAPHMDALRACHAGLPQ